MGKLKVFLKQAGFRVHPIQVKTFPHLHIVLFSLQDTDISYVPCSGLTGENLVHQPTDELLLRWYQGPTLLDTIGIVAANTLTL